MIKQPDLNFSELNLSVIKCNCWTYEDNIGKQFKKAKLCKIGGVKYVRKISFTGIDPRFVRNIKKRF